MFNRLQTAPPDPILGLTEAYKKDSNPQKINLGVGIYLDAKGTTPTLQTVRKAEARLLEADAPKTYLPIPGPPEYGRTVRELVFGNDSGVLAGDCAVTLQTPGGTGALRVGGDFIFRISDRRPTIWLSDPTWANHKGIFGAAGFQIAAYPYYDAESKSIRLEEMLEAIGRMPAGDILLLQGICHNPTGLDPDPDQWEAIARAVDRSGVLPFIDFAYQGFAEGIEEDAAAVRIMCREGRRALVASSFSKNFGLYCERVGALTIVGANPDEAAAALSHAKLAVRTNYSNPPRHGGAIVSTILDDSDLRARWTDEVAAMRDRINQMRTSFVQTLADKGVDQDFSFIADQNGMFSFSGLTPDHVQALREDYSIYIVKNGRINVAAITPDNIDYLCEAVADVLKR